MDNRGTGVIRVGPCDCHAYYLKDQQQSETAESLSDFIVGYICRRVIPGRGATGRTQMIREERAPHRSMCRLPAVGAPPPAPRRARRIHAHARRHVHLMCSAK
ncbi:unnamed protein product [Pieris brassicae]|uniref:Uncharacterized protein n=1 Tax=Pieris brassicae TaxID=7116 RepID=A0A9P0XC93_PIEBR|nr:unnamed protein product [Pieris brassicae]